MAREVCSEEYEVKEASQVQNPVGEDDLATQKEFDFVERPSEDFFCPVTFELLLNPHQTTCCGNHLSEKAVHRLQRDGKPCPMCKEPELSTMPDKFHRRRVSAVRVRCPHTPSGCEWMGEVRVVDQHTAACPKRLWQCQYCEFTSTNDLQKEHVEQCTKYPIPCPNKCEIGTVPRCDVEEHRTECPLEPVACEFAEVGCSVKVARRDLKLHMEESQQQHLLSATLLNLKLTRETIAEKDRLLALKEQKLSQMLAENERQLAEKDRQIADKDEKLAEKDHLIADKDHQLKEKGSIIADKEKQLGELQTELKKFRLEFMEPTKIALDHLLSAIGGKFTFVLYEFSSLQKKGNYGDWFSHPFSIDGYNLKLNVETKVRGPNMKIRLYHAVDSGHQSMTFVATILLLNQVVDHSHYSKQLVIDLPSGPCSRPYNLIAFKELHRKDHTVQYLKDDSLKIHMWIKHKT